MNTSLPAFVFNTLLGRMNDPSNAAFFLPGLLAAMTSGDAKVLPLTASRWDLGEIGGEAGATLAAGFAGGWYTSVPRPEGEKHCGIPWPPRRVPTVTLTGVTISALENVTMDPSPVITPTAGGYRLEIGLTQGRYAGVPGVTAGPVAIDCTYEITQWVCSAGSGDGIPDDYAGPEPVVGTGELRGTISSTRARADATDILVKVAADLGVGREGGLELIVAGVQVSVPVNASVYPPAPYASFHVADMTVDSTQDRELARTEVQLASGVLNTPQALASILDNLNRAMGTSGYLGALQVLLNSALHDALDSVLGPLPPSGPVGDPVAPGTNPVDAYLFRRIHTSLATPGTDYYLPGVILFFQDPVLEPYSGGGISIPDQETQGVTFHDIALTGLTITGASNAVLPAGSMTLVQSTLLEGTTISATALVSTLSPGPTLTSGVGGVPQTRTVPSPPLSITAGFSITPGTSPTPITGTVNITVRNARIHAVFTVAGTDLSTFAITFGAVTVSADPADVEIDVKLKKGSRTLEAMIDTVLRSPASVNQVIGALNARIAAQLPDLGRTATANVRTLAAASLDG
jgi:hypothetical protein